MTDNSSESAGRLLAPLRQWLGTKIPGATNIVISDVVEPTQGFSSRTIMFRVSWLQNGALCERALVARIQRDASCPMLADVFHQYQVMKAVALVSDVAIPPLYMAEPSPAILGSPFFLMDHVQGRTPPDFPSYHAQGWFSEELTAAERERAWWNGVEEMERLHRIGWEAFPFLGNGLSRPPGPGFYIEHFIVKWYNWASKGRAYPLIDAAIGYLLDHQPRVERSGLVWNDARMGNTMFAHDLSIAALVDFEVATLGPAEIDLAWWLYAEDIFSMQFGVERIRGIPDRETAIHGFQQIYERSMPDFSYYEAIAALKHVVISLRDYGNGKLMDKPREALPDFAARRLSEYLERHGCRTASS